MMKFATLRSTPFVAAVLVVTSGAAMAATPGQKMQARQDLDQVTTSLQAVDTAYASGNAAEAQTRYDQARTGWSKVSPVISAREAREQQLLFDNLGKELTGSAPPKKVHNTVTGMLDELREDIARELR
jgi:hypothetical protein